jgi:1-acyl-sn-glycerol-3-phosphate acyltransferase
MIRRLERLWRQLGAGIAFLLFGIGGLLLTVFVFPAISLIFRDRTRRAAAAQRMVHLTWKFFVWIIVMLGVIEFEMQGEDLLHQEKGTLVIANHPSLLDVVLIMSMMDRTQCVVKPGAWRNPFMRGVIKAANYIPNLGDPERTLSECISALQAGNNLVIFPEGSRTVPGRRRRLERGFANIAIRSGAPIRLVTVSCVPVLLAKGDKWYTSPLRRPRYQICVQDRIDPVTFARADVPSRAARNLTAQVARRFEELIPNEYA